MTRIGHNKSKKDARPPRPIQVFKFDQNNKLVFNCEEVSAVLKHPDVKDKEVCVVSIAGAFRQGKSFILNFFIRYLCSICNKSNSTEWLKPEDGPLSGFSFKSGSDKHTVGIWMWSEIFICKLPGKKKEVAIVLLDSQGTFDNETTLTEWTSIFALSVLINSLLIYNLKENLKQDDLSHLQLFSGYGRMMSENDNEKPFQKLLFLIRDWQWLDEGIGFEGGNKLLKKAFDSLEKSKKEELLSIKNSINENFEDKSCFLLRHPGEKVSTAKFKGEIEDIDARFIEQVKDFVSQIFAPDKITPKVINNRKITVEELANLIETYWKHFKDGKAPKVVSMYMATTEAQLDLAMRKALNLYKSLMNNCKSADETDKIILKVLDHFRKEKKLGERAQIQEYENSLINELRKIYDKNYKSVFQDREFASNVRIGIIGGVAATTAALAATGVAVGSAATEVAVVSALVGGAGLVVGGVVGLGIYAGYKLWKWRSETTSLGAADVNNVNNTTVEDVEVEGTSTEVGTGNAEKIENDIKQNDILGDGDEASSEKLENVGRRGESTNSASRDFTQLSGTTTAQRVPITIGFLTGIVVMVALILAWFGH